MEESKDRPHVGLLLQVVRDDIRVREGTVTYDDYARLPDDGQRFEVANGNLELMSPAPSPKHQLWLGALWDVLKECCRNDFIFLVAPVDVILGPKEVRQPDIVGVKLSRASIITNRGIEGPPDFVVEVLSPYSAKRDKVDKADAYARYGVPEYWIVTLEVPMIEQFVFLAGGMARPVVFTGTDVVESEVVPCARFTVADVANRVPRLEGL